jgi:hypothetical protein
MEVRSGDSCMLLFPSAAGRRNTARGRATLSCGVGAPAGWLVRALGHPPMVLTVSSMLTSDGNWDSMPAIALDSASSSL